MELDVSALLNGVELDKPKREKDLGGESLIKINVFYSYSHKDENLRQELDTHLKLLQRQGLIDAWHDRRIEGGEKWKDEIDEKIRSADLILLLVSSDFIASDYCWEKEMRLALERHEAREARVVPIIVRDVNWKSALFAELQAFPRDGVAVTKWSNKDTAWRDVAEGVERIATEIRRKKLKQRQS